VKQVLAKALPFLVLDEGSVASFISPNQTDTDASLDKHYFLRQPSATDGADYISI
jgi:hypothetical protein